jgi:hypothetical protein
VPDNPIVQIYDYFEPDQTGTLFGTLLEEAGIKIVNICLISGRCGSTYFGHLGGIVGLNSTKTLEPFHELHADVIAQAFPERDLADYLRRVIARCRAGDRFFFQITPYRLRAAGRLFGLENMMAACDCFSVILRRNILSQALSYESATSSGVWHARGKVTTAQRSAAEPEAVLPWIEMINNTETDIATLLEGVPHKRYFYEDIAAQPLEIFLSYLDHHDFPISVAQLQAAFSSDDSPKKLLKADYATSYLRCLERYPWIKDILSRRNGGDLVNAEIAQWIQAENPAADDIPIADIPIEAEMAPTVAVSTPPVQSQTISAPIQQSSRLLRRIFRI